MVCHSLYKSMMNFEYYCSCGINVRMKHSYQNRVGPGFSVVGRGHAYTLMTGQGDDGALPVSSVPLSGLVCKGGQGGKKSCK